MADQPITDAARLGQFLAHFDQQDRGVSITAVRVFLAVVRGADSAAAITRLLAEEGMPVARRTVHQHVNDLQGIGRTLHGKPAESCWQLLQSRPHPHHKQALQLQLSRIGRSLMHTFYPDQPLPKPAKRPAT